jgi:hypothetical protein
MPTVSGTVGTPWFHPGSSPEGSAAVPGKLFAVIAGRRGRLLGTPSRWEPGSEGVFAAMAAQGFQPVALLSGGRWVPLLVLVNAFALFDWKASIAKKPAGPSGRRGRLPKFRAFPLHPSEHEEGQRPHQHHHEVRDVMGLLGCSKDGTEQGV